MIKSIILGILILGSFESRAQVKHGLIHTPKGPKKAYYEHKEGLHVTEWDILVEPYKKNRNGEKAVTRYFGKWKNKTVPYVIDESLPNQGRIDYAIDYLNLNTSLRFIKRTNERDYIYFKNNGDGGCYSWMGRVGGKQAIHIANWCETREVLHEIFHALGFNHEQSRLDRNKYIKVIWDNIQVMQVFNYFMAPFSKNYGKFDFESIMLYPSFNGFARDIDKPTMVRRDNGKPFGYVRNTPSAQDLAALEARYK